MSNLKFTTLRQLQKYQTLERKNFKNEFKKDKQYSRKFDTLKRNQNKKREYYKYKIKENKYKLFKKTQAKIKGKSRDEIKDIWQNYRTIKKQTFSGYNLYYGFKEHNLSTYNLLSYTFKKNDYNLIDFDNRINKVIFNKDKKISSIILTCTFINEFGIKDYNSISYSDYDIYNFNDFKNWFIDTLPIMIMGSSNFDYASCKILQYGINVYFK